MKKTLQLGLDRPGPHSIAVLDENGNYVASLAELMAGPIDLRIPPKSLAGVSPPAVTVEMSDLECDPELTGRLKPNRKIRRLPRNEPRRTLSASLDGDIAAAIEAEAAALGLTTSEWIRAVFVRMPAGPSEVVADDQAA